MCYTMPTGKRSRGGDQNGLRGRFDGEGGRKDARLRLVLAPRPASPCAARRSSPSAAAMAVVVVGRAAASARPARAAVAASGLLGRLSGALLRGIPFVSADAARADAPAPLLCCRSSGSRPWLSLCASAKLCAPAPAPRSPSCGALAFWPCRRRPLRSAGPRPRPVKYGARAGGWGPRPFPLRPGGPYPSCLPCVAPGGALVARLAGEGLRASPLRCAAFRVAPLALAPGRPCGPCRVPCSPADAARPGRLVSKGERL